jgi:hypothetical protein
LLRRGRGEEEGNRRRERGGGKGEKKEKGGKPANRKGFDSNNEWRPFGFFV